jgi:hypothetical protein
VPMSRKCRMPASAVRQGHDPRQSSDLAGVAAGSHSGGVAIVTKGGRVADSLSSSATTCCSARSGDCAPNLIGPGKNVFRYFRWAGIPRVTDRRRTSGSPWPPGPDQGAAPHGAAWSACRRCGPGDREHVGDALLLHRKGRCAARPGQPTHGLARHPSADLKALVWSVQRPRRTSPYALPQQDESSCSEPFISAGRRAFSRTVSVTHRNAAGRSHPEAGGPMGWLAGFLPGQYPGTTGTSWRS